MEAHSRRTAQRSAWPPGLSRATDWHGCCIVPEPWTIETLVLRQTAFANATSELQLARSVAQLGVNEANRRSNPDPPEALAVPEGLDIAAFDRIGEDVVAATRAGGPLPRPEILPRYRGLPGAPSGGVLDEGAVSDPGATTGS